MLCLKFRRHHTIAAVTCPVLIIGEIVRLIGRYRS